jgi:hypothetical protein
VEPQCQRRKKLHIAATHGAEMERDRKDIERNRCGQKVQTDIGETKPAAGQPK